MARGDAYTDTVVDVPANGYVEIQPAAGVEVMLFHVTIKGIDYIVLRGGEPGYFPAHRYTFGLEGGETAVTGIEEPAYAMKRPLKLLITNSHFIRAYNKTAYTTQIGYHGVQTK